VGDVHAASTDLERRLLQKQRTLEGQLTEARLRAHDSQEEAKVLRGKLEVAEDARKDLRHLVSQLELQLGSSSRSTEGAQLHGLLPGKSTESPVGAMTGSISSAGGSGEAPEDMPSMLDIVAGQRDRLRERCGELEQDRDRLRSAVDQERKRADTFRADNVKLMERARFLQSLQPKQGRARGTRDANADADLESRYGTESQEEFGPVSAYDKFREDEKARRLAGLNAGERVLVLSSSLLLSSRVARVFALGYLGAMHLLVFLVLFRLAHEAHKQC